MTSSPTSSGSAAVTLSPGFGMGQWGEKLHLTFALHVPLHKGNGWSVPGHRAPAFSKRWAATLAGEALLQQRRRIARLKRNLASACRSSRGCRKKLPSPKRLSIVYQAHPTHTHGNPALPESTYRESAVR
jgi:hypothetical protein